MSDDFFGIHVQTHSSTQRAAANTAPEPAQEEAGFIEKQFIPSSSRVAEPAVSHDWTRETEDDFIDQQYFRKIDPREASEPECLQSPKRRDQGKWFADDESIQKRSDASFAEDYEEPIEIDEKEFTISAPTILQQINSSLLPIKHLSKEELVDYLASQVLYNDEDLLALCKPYGLSYGGGSSDLPQIDRLMPALKAVVAPATAKLHLAKPLDRNVSGILLFVKNEKLKHLLNQKSSESLVMSEYRAIVRGTLAKPKQLIKIPLYKTVRDGQFKMKPLREDTPKRHEIHYVETRAREISSHRYCSYVGALVKGEVPHQVRAHLSLVKCPIIGEDKYTDSPPRPPRLADATLEQLGLSQSQSRRLPFLLHHKERIVLKFDDWPLVRIHYDWETRLRHLFLKRLEVERLLWILSSLGGAYSAMGDYDERFARVAMKISNHQIRLATEYGDPVLLSRCHLYIALSLAQQGYHKEAKQVVRWQSKMARLYNSSFLLACCQGIRAKITAIIYDLR
ncbi:unnamed protein product, partial [Mesorhabditis spiculigera]